MHHRIIENNQVEMNLLLRLSLVNLVISNLISLAIVVHQPILVRFHVRMADDAEEEVC